MPAPRTVTNAPGPKAILAAVAAAVLTYLVTQNTLDLPPIADVALTAFLVGLAAWIGTPQQTVPSVALPAALLLVVMFGAHVLPLVLGLLAGALTLARVRKGFRHPPYL